MSTTASLSPTLSIQRGGLGQVALRRLDWDTEFFGAQFAIISGIEVEAAVEDRRAAATQLLAELSALAADEGFDHLTYRPPLDDWALVQAAERDGWSLVDLGVDFWRRDDGPKTVAPEIRPSRDADLPALRALAGSAFVYSRFAMDRFFTPEQVEAFHRQWVTNLHNGLARVVLVAEQDGRLQGFVSCALDATSGRIPLIAVDASRRRHGLGRALVASALDWFHAAGATEVRVKTQSTNIPAVQLYERAGFLLERSELTFTKDLRPLRAGKDRLQA